MKKFSIYEFERDGVISTCEFFPSEILPAELPISTPFTFPFIERKVVLALDKNEWWNPLGGHIESGENWTEALAREAEEEAGVGIKDVILAGYIKVIKSGNLSNSKYPVVSVLPITYSRVSSVTADWQAQETSQRMSFGRKEADAVLASRDDSAQMLEIFDYIYSLKSLEKLTYEFEYFENIMLPDVPVTQVFVFCVNDQKKFCVVRDSDEKHYSLPGGGAELGEKAEDAARREMLEETQIDCGNMQLLGSNIVSYIENGRVVEQVQQVRFFCEADQIPEFIPNYKGFETEERLFVSLAELPEYVTWLKEPLPQKILQQIREIL